MSAHEEKRPLPESEYVNNGIYNQAFQPHSHPPHATRQPAPPPPYVIHPGHNSRLPLPNTAHHEQQRETVKTEVIRSHKPTDCMRSTTPRLPKGLARTFCIMNCIIPGWGTIGAAFAACCYEQYEDDEYKPCCPKCNSCFGTFCFGFLQFVTTAFFGLGFIWSILWGFELLRASNSTKTVVTTTTTTTTNARTTHVEAASGTRRPMEHASEYPTVHLNAQNSQLPPGRV